MAELEMDAWKRHLDSQEAYLASARANLKASDPKYQATLMALAKEEKELAASYRAYNECLLQADKLDNEAYSISVEKEAQAAKADNEADKIATEERIEQAKLSQEKKALKIRTIIDIGALLVSIASLVHAFMDLVGRDRRFKIASKYEEEDAYLKLSDKEAVQDGLRTRKF